MCLIYFSLTLHSCCFFMAYWQHKGNTNTSESPHYTQKTNASIEIVSVQQAMNLTDRELLRSILCV